MSETVPCPMHGMRVEQTGHVRRATSGVGTRAMVGRAGVGPQDGWLQAPVSFAQRRLRAEAIGRLRRQAGGSLWNGPSGVLPWHGASARVWRG